MSPSIPSPGIPYNIYSRLKWESQPIPLAMIPRTWDCRLANHALESRIMELGGMGLDAYQAKPARENTSGS